MIMQSMPSQLKRRFCCGALWIIIRKIGSYAFLEAAAAKQKARDYHPKRPAAFIPSESWTKKRMSKGIENEIAKIDWGTTTDLTK